MRDILTCPICGDKLRSIKRKNKIFDLNQEAYYVERLCVKNISHFLQFFTDEGTGKVDLINISLTPNRSKFIRINFYTNISKVLSNFPLLNEVIIPKIIEPDFPDLIILKDKIKLYITFS